jgi:hypothetical protein
MLRKEEFLKTHPEVRTGMTAYSVGGDRLGVVEQINEDGVMIERGRVFHKDFYVPYDDIEDVRDKDIVIRPSRGQAWEGWSQEPWEEHRYAGAEAEMQTPGRMRERETGGYTGREEQADVPGDEERLRAPKRENRG